jgi:hypothetical protein
VGLSLKGEEEGKEGTTTLFEEWDPTPQDSSVTDHRYFQHCGQCIERSLLCDGPSIAAPLCP